MKKKTIPELMLSQVDGQMIFEKVKSSIEIVELSDTDAIVETLRHIIPKEKIPVQEHVVSILVGHDLQPLGFIRLATGAVDQVSYEFQNVMFCAANLRAFGFIMAHTHPDDDLRASEADIESMWRNRAWSKMLNIGYIDEIILGPEKHFSFEDAEML